VSDRVSEAKCSGGDTFVEHVFRWRADLVRRDDAGKFLGIVAIRYRCDACGLWLRVAGDTGAETFSREMPES
jgi:hypothetical protein